MRDDEPEGWVQATLGEIITLEYGRALPEPSRIDGDVPVYGSNGPVGSHNEHLVGERGIVVGRKGTAGSVHVTSGAFWPIDTTYYVRTRRDVDFGWLAALLRHANLGSLNEATGVPGLNRENAYRKAVLVPPLDEQGRIADVLRQVEETIAATQAVMLEADVLWQAMAETLIWNAAEKGGECMRPLGTALLGSDYGVNVPLSLEEVGHPILRMGNIQNGRLDMSDMKWGEVPHHEAADLALREGDILFNRTNSRDLVGKVALVREPTECLYASYIVRLSVNRMTADPYYLFAAMHSDRAQVSFRAIATPGVSQSNINPTNLKKQLVPLPNLPTQRTIADQLRSVEEVCFAAKQELATLHVIKKDLASDLLSGRVRVPA